MASPESIIVDALREININEVSEESIPEDYAAICLSKFNRRIGQWNTRRPFGSYEYSQIFTLPASPTISPNGYSIGATADSPKLIVTGGRAPNQIDFAKRVTADSTPQETPIPVLSFQQWNALRIPGLITSLTVAVYLQTIPKLPILWCYGFSSGNKLRLSWRNLLNSVALASIATTIDLQDGYEDALILTLAEDLSGPFKVPISPDLARRAREARMNIMGLNGKPEIMTSDFLTDGSEGYSIADFEARNL